MAAELIAARGPRSIPLPCTGTVQEYLAFLGTVLPTASTASNRPVSGSQSTPGTARNRHFATVPTF